MKLSEIKAGETFKTGNLEAICLEHRKDGTTLCWLKDSFYILKSSVSVSTGKIDLFVTATEIAERLSNANFDDITDDSGYFVVREFEDGRERTVDVYKSTGYGTQKPYYTVYCSFEDEDHDFYYTEDLSIEGLYKTLKEIADVEVA